MYSTQGCTCNNKCKRLLVWKIFLKLLVLGRPTNRQSIFPIKSKLLQVKCLAAFKAYKAFLNYIFNSLLLCILLHDDGFNCMPLAFYVMLSFVISNPAWWLCVWLVACSHWALIVNYVLRCHILPGDGVCSVPNILQEMGKLSLFPVDGVRLVSKLRPITGEGSRHERFVPRWIWMGFSASSVVSERCNMLIIKYNIAKIPSVKYTIV